MSRVAPPARGPSERQHDVSSAVVHAPRAAAGLPRRRWWESDAGSSAVAGATSGIVCALVVAPFDVVKARKQVDERALQGGTFQSLRLIRRREGLPGLFRGLPPTVLGYVPSYTVYFSSYNWLRERLHERWGAGWPLWCTVSSAVAAGAVTNMVTNPFWVVRTRLQVQNHVTQVPEYHGTFDAFRKIFRSEGPRGFYRGLAASMLGLSHVAVQFPLYEWLKKRLMPPGRVGAGSRDWQRAGALMTSSMVSKTIATVLTYPHDIARSRLHVETTADRPSARSSSPLLRISVFRMIHSIYVADGFLGLYAGLQTQLIRTVPSCTLSFTTFELIYSVLSSER